jgi:glyoxylase-like metal-dependent hydrolase (beta-lactamase superfamily II)
MSTAFASTADTAERRVSFTELAAGAYAFTAEGDPNSGVVVGDDCALVFDAQATPRQAGRVIEQARRVTRLPIRYVVLSHYHAVRTLGASAYAAHEVIASRLTYDLLIERGEQDWKSEVGRFPRLFEDAASIPGLTWPTITFETSLTLFLGRRRVDLIHLGHGHTAGDVVLWLPEDRVMFAGDLVEHGATPYCGDAHLRDWPRTLDKIATMAPAKLLPGRGGALHAEAQVAAAIAGTRGFVADLYRHAADGVAAGRTLQQVYATALEAMRPRYGDWVIFQHCMPFNVSRAFDEALGTSWPRIWTAERDREMWQALEAASER